MKSGKPIAKAEPGRLLLDTHVWLWAVEGVRGKLSARCLTALRKANQQGHIWVSVISAWEIAMLESLGRIILSKDCQEWVDTELAVPGMNLAHITPRIAVDSTRLPDEFHRDPADRFLVATARQLGAILVTLDEKILKYSQAGYVNAMDAGK